MFAHYHRHSYTGCKTAVSEVIASQAALVADVNDIAKESHVRSKLCDIIQTAELVFAAGEAACRSCRRVPSGQRVPDEVLTNAGRRLAGHNIYHEYETMADLTGGVVRVLCPRRSPSMRLRRLSCATSILCVTRPTPPRRPIGSCA